VRPREGVRGPEHEAPSPEDTATPTVPRILPPTARASLASWCSAGVGRVCHEFFHYKCISCGRWAA
jgi:hypothetical protein